MRAPGDVLVHLRRARDRVDRHFIDPHELAELADIADIADIAGMSKFHFQRLSRPPTG